MHTYTHVHTYIHTHTYLSLAWVIICSFSNMCFNSSSDIVPWPSSSNKLNAAAKSYLLLLSSPKLREIRLGQILKLVKKAFLVVIASTLSLPRFLSSLSLECSVEYVYQSFSSISFTLSRQCISCRLILLDSTLFIHSFNPSLPPISHSFPPSLPSFSSIMHTCPSLPSFSSVMHTHTHTNYLLVQQISLLHVSSSGGLDTQSQETLYPPSHYPCLCRPQHTDKYLIFQNR